MLPNSRIEPPNCSTPVERRSLPAARQSFDEIDDVERARRQRAAPHHIP